MDVSLLSYFSRHKINWLVNNPKHTKNISVKIAKEMNFVLLSILWFKMYSHGKYIANTRENTHNTDDSGGIQK